MAKKKGSIFTRSLTIACTTWLLKHLCLNLNTPTVVWRVRPNRMSMPKMYSGIGVIDTLYSQGGRHLTPSFNHVWVTGIICPPNPPIIAFLTENWIGSPCMIDASVPVSTSAVTHCTFFQESSFQCRVSGPL